MQTDVSDLLYRCGLRWDDSFSPPNMPQGPVRWLGRASESSEVSRPFWPFLGYDIWVAERDWPAVTSSDLQRWLVDANEGEHLIILHGNDEIPNAGLPESVILYDRNRFAEVIGRHILEVGDITSKKVEQEFFADSKTAESSQWSGEIGLNPSLRPDEILERLGFTGLGLRPLHLQAKLWRVSGILEGPDGEHEMHDWLILEDPWSEQLKLLQDHDILENPPDLEKQESNQLSSIEIIRIRLQGFLSQRRASGLDQGSGTVLKSWKAVIQSSEMSSQEILIPAWKGSLPGYGEALLHGLDGTVLTI